MTLGTREEIINFISNSGATLCDVAASYGTTPEEVSKELEVLNVPLPSMNFEGPFDFIKGLKRGVTNKCPAYELISDPFGGVQHLPKGQRGEYIPNIRLIYNAIHGDKFLDPYSGKEVPCDDLLYVNGDENNFLITNIEAIGNDTWKERFDHPIGLTSETFKFNTRHFNIELEIGRKYDQLVGGTYNPDYVHQLFCTWVGYPLNLYFKRNVEEETMFKNKTPTFVAWWIWSQLSNYALLKGITSIVVTTLDVRSLDQFSSKQVSASTRSLAPATMQHSAKLTNNDVLTAMSKVVKKSQSDLMLKLAIKDEEKASL